MRGIIVRRRKVRCFECYQYWIYDQKAYLSQEKYEEIIMEGAGVLEYGMRGLCNTASALPTTCFSVTAQQQEETR